MIGPRPDDLVWAGSWEPPAGLHFPAAVAAAPIPGNIDSRWLLGKHLAAVPCRLGPSATRLASPVQGGSFDLRCTDYALSAGGVSVTRMSIPSYDHGCVAQRGSIRLTHERQAPGASRGFIYICKAGDRHVQLFTIADTYPQARVRWRQLRALVARAPRRQ